MDPKRRVLLVEGRDDEQVICQFCNACSIPNQSLFTVKSLGGFENLRADLGVRVKSGNDPVVGVVFDADDPSVTNRWESLRDVLREQGIAAPDAAVQGGSVIDGRIRVGLWQMPDNQAPGMLEDFLGQLRRDTDVLYPHAEQVVADLPERRFSPVHRTKVILHTWLAWQEEPGTPLGHALTRRYLDVGCSSGVAFAAWLRRLFPPGP